MDYKEKVIALLNSQELSKEQKEKLENIFPELKESEDERIRKAIISCCIDHGSKYKYGASMEEMCAWLEKQDKQQPTAYGHKFREGDIVKSKSRPTLDARKIIYVDKNRGCYWCEDNMCFGFTWEDDYELVEQHPTDDKEKLEVLKFIRKETGCGLADANNALLKLIKVLKQHPLLIMDKPHKLKIEWEE